jgi:transposase
VAFSEAVGVCPRTVCKWVARFRAEGVADLRDRSSRPRHARRATLPETVVRIEALPSHAEPARRSACGWRLDVDCLTPFAPT